MYERALQAHVFPTERRCVDTKEAGEVCWEPRRREGSLLREKVHKCRELIPINKTEGCGLAGQRAG